MSTRDADTRVLLLNDSTPESNWGGRAATVSLRAMIEEKGGRIVRTLAIDRLMTSDLDGRPAPTVCASSRTRERIKLFVPPIVSRLKTRLVRPSSETCVAPLVPRTWDEYEPCASRWLGTRMPWPGLLTALGDVDLVVVFGDGDIYGNGLLPRTLLYLSYVAKRHFGLPVIMVDHSADFEDERLRRAARHVYPLFDDVVFRDPVSAERCESMCRGRVAADTAFWFEPARRETWAPLAARPTYFDVWPDTAAFDPAAPYICLGGSSIIDTASDKTAVIAGFNRLIEHLRSAYEGQIVLTASDLVDAEIFRPIARRSGLPLVGVTVPVQQAVDIVGNADAYVGGRWHTSIFALRGGVPVLPLSSKTFKMLALAGMAGLPTITFDALDLAGQADEIGRRLAGYLEQGDELRTRLRSWAAGMAQSSWENVTFFDRLHLSI